jgi:hypothetical protein
VCASLRYTTPLLNVADVLTGGVPKAMQPTVL